MYYLYHRDNKEFLGKSNDVKALCESHDWSGINQPITVGQLGVILEALDTPTLLELGQKYAPDKAQAYGSDTPRETLRIAIFIALTGRPPKDLIKKEIITAEAWVTEPRPGTNASKLWSEATKELNNKIYRGDIELVSSNWASFRVCVTGKFSDTNPNFLTYQLQQWRRFHRQTKTEVKTMATNPAKKVTKIAPTPAKAKEPLARGRVASAEKQNGVSKPSEGTATGKVWSICDKLRSKNKNNDAPLKTEVIEAAEKQSINGSTAATQYGKWLKFHGLKSISSNSVAKAAPAKAAPAKAEAPKKAVPPAKKEAVKKAAPKKAPVEEIDEDPDYNDDGGEDYSDFAGDGYAE